MKKSYTTGETFCTFCRIHLVSSDILADRGCIDVHACLYRIDITARHLGIVFVDTLNVWREVV